MKSKVSMQTPGKLKRLKASELSPGVYRPYSLTYRDACHDAVRIVVLPSGGHRLFVNADGHVAVAIPTWHDDTQYEYERVSDDHVIITFTNNEK